MASPFLASDTGVAIGNIAASQAAAPLQNQDGTNLPALPANKYRILSFTIMAGGTQTDVTLINLNSGVAITPKYPVAANGGLSPPYNPYGHGDTAEGDTIGVKTGSGATVAVSVTYGKIAIGH